MTIIMFGDWNHKAGKLFCFDRVFTNSGKPTMFVVARFRHVGKPPVRTN